MNKKEYDEWYWKQVKRDEIKEEILDVTLTILTVFFCIFVAVSMWKAVCVWMA